MRKSLLFQCLAVIAPFFFSTLAIGAASQPELSIELSSVKTNYGLGVGVKIGNFGVKKAKSVSLYINQNLVGPLTISPIPQSSKFPDTRMLEGMIGHFYGEFVTGAGDFHVEIRRGKKVVIASETVTVQDSSDPPPPPPPPPEDGTFESYPTCYKYTSDVTLVFFMSLAWNGETPPSPGVTVAFSALGKVYEGAVTDENGFLEVRFEMGKYEFFDLFEGPTTYRVDIGEIGFQAEDYWFLYTPKCN